MTIVGMDSLLAHALHHHYAIGYFEAWDQHSFEAVLEAAEEANSPIILGFGGAVTQKAWLDRWGVEEHASLAMQLAEKSKVPTAVLFNEAQTYEEIVRGLRLGCNAVMLDTSHLPYEENLHLTKKVVETAHALGATVESELGHLADASDSSSHGTKTDPKQAAEFVKQSNIDALAVSIGNVHLLLDGQSPVDLELLEDLHRSVPVPLVIHGGTGFPASAVKASIERGVAKFNVGTILKKAFLNGLQEALANLPKDPNVHIYVGVRGPEDIMEQAKAKMKVELWRLMKLYESAGKASLW